MVVSRHEAKTFTLYLKEYVMFRSKVCQSVKAFLVSGVIASPLLIMCYPALKNEKMLALRGGGNCYEITPVNCPLAPDNRVCTEFQCEWWNLALPPGWYCDTENSEDRQLKTTYDTCSPDANPGLTKCTYGTTQYDCWVIYACGENCNTDQNGTKWCAGVAGLPAAWGGTHTIPSRSGSVCPP